MSVLMELLNNGFDGFVDLLGALLLFDFMKFIFAVTEGQRLLLMVLSDALDNLLVRARFDFSVGNKEGGILVILDNLVVVTETTVEDSVGFSIFTAIDTEVFNDAAASRAG